MPSLALMSRAVDFIEDHLQKNITVADMAEAVSYSLYHFCRTFNQATHHTPYDYLMRRRLSESARELLQSDKKIIDIALGYQFNNPETFSRAFKRVFDTQPSQLRKQGSIDARRLMPRMTRAHLQQVSQGWHPKPVVEEKAAFQVAGLMTLVKRGPAAISEIWDLLVKELEDNAPIAEPRNYYGVAHYPRDWKDRGFLYMAAIEVQGLDALCGAWVVKRIPALRYARFIHRGSARNLSLALDYVYHTWLPKSGYRLARPLVVEHYGQRFRGLSDADVETSIYVPVQALSP